MTLEEQCAQDLAESNHGHEDFQSVLDAFSNPLNLVWFPEKGRLFFHDGIYRSKNRHRGLKPMLSSLNLSATSLQVWLMAT
jgi:hypothetical protein